MHVDVETMINCDQILQNQSKITYQAKANYQHQWHSYTIALLVLTFSTTQSTVLEAGFNRRLFWVVWRA